MSANSIICTYTKGFGTQPGSSDSGSTHSRDDDQTPSQLGKLTRNPSTVARLFPSMHTLSSLSSVRDSSRYSGKMTTHLNEDVGIIAKNSAHIGHGAQFDVRRVRLCCNKGFYVQKSALSAAYRKRATWNGKGQEEAEQRLIRAVFLEYRALSHPPIREHPNVVDILDLGWETDPENRKDKWPVLILEYADQGTMTAFLGQSQFSLETRTKLCLDVAKGLAVLHASGIIHGDLKMDNVLIFTNPGVDSASVNKYTAKLADFGASLAAPDGTQSPSYTKPWNAPECFEKLNPTGLKQVDIYSFGLLCWAVMLHGKNPFQVVESVAQRLSPNDWDSSLETLKKADGGSELLRLARESFTEAFGRLKPPVMAVDATVQLDPAKRDLSKAVTALDEFLEPLRTDDEASAAQSKPISLVKGPEICSHSLILNSDDLQRYRGPLKTYLTEWFQEPRDSPNTANDLPGDDDRVARCLLAELELDDWLEGRSPDPSKAITQYRAMRSLFIWETSILYRLAGLQPKEGFDEVVPDTIKDNLAKAFYAGFTPAQEDIFLKFPNWTMDWIGFALVSSGGGISEPLSWELYKILTDPDQANVCNVLRRAFPGLGITKQENPDSGIELLFDMDIDYTATILDQGSGNSAIHILSQVGAFSLLEQLLRNPGVDLNARNKELETPLILACRAGRFSTAMLLVEKGADVSLQNAFKENPLHWLSSFCLFPEQMEELARVILAKGTRDLLTAEAKYRESGDFPEHRLFPGTPICRAIIKGCDKAAILLWEMEREAFAPARPAYRGIIYAAQLHNHCLLDAFLEGPESLVHPESGVSLLYAASFGMGSLSNSPIGRILRHGVRCGQSGVETLKVLCKYGAKDHFASIPGLPHCNILSLAVYECVPEVVEFLLKELDCAHFVNIDAPPPSISLARARGDDVRYGIENWKSSLLCHAMQTDRRLVFELLLKYGADVNQVLNSEDGPLTTLHYGVVLTREPSYIKMLLDTGKIVDIDRAEPNFESPFATAVCMRKFDIAECLLAHGADVNHLSINGIRSFPVDQPAETILGKVLQQEASLSSLACVSFLLETGKASPYTNRDLNLTVLHSLGMRMSTSVSSNEMFVRRAFSLLNVEFHFSKQVLDARNPHGYTALDLAVYNDKAALVEELLLAGAEWDIVLPNPSGIDPPLVDAMKRMYHFPHGVLVEENCPPKEEQLEIAFSKRRHICWMLCQKTRERAREVECGAAVRQHDQEHHLGLGGDT